MIQNFKSHHRRPKPLGDLPRPPFCSLVTPAQITWSRPTFVFPLSIFQRLRTAKGPHGPHRLRKVMHPYILTSLHTHVAAERDEIVLMGY